MRMMRTRSFVVASVLASGLLLPLSTAGCAGESKQTQKEKATAQWNGTRAAVMLSLAGDQYQNGNFDKCRKTLTDAERMDPTNAKVRVLSAKLAIEQGQLELAEKELAIARESDPADAVADYLSGVVCQRWQKPERAYEFYSQAAEKAPNELPYVLARAEMLVTMDRANEALALLQEKVVFFEHSAAIRDAAGELLVQQGRYADAVEMLRQASILANNDNQVREHLAMAQYLNKQYREASENFARLLKDTKNQKRYDLYLAQGECQLAMGKCSEARGSFELASRLSPSSVQAWTGTAKAALQNNDTRRADLALKRAVALDGNSAETQLLLGYLRLKENKMREALAAFHRASQLDSKDTVSLCMIGYVLEKNGQGAKAMEYYGRALKLKPNDEMAKQLMASTND
jgi:Flp pilus assembly protein TadD